MVLLYILGFIYGSVGLVYALYIMFNEIDPWYQFPINFLFGPVALIYNSYKFLLKKQFPRMK